MSWGKTQEKFVYEIRFFLLEIMYRNLKSAKNSWAARCAERWKMIYLGDVIELFCQLFDTHFDCSH